VPCRLGHMQAQCVICFEELPPDFSVQLPCSCKVDYCRKCWDRALAESWRASGTAHCPTCRTFVRVDLCITPIGSSPPCYLRFSRETRSVPSVSRRDEQARLTEQARPVQRELLHRFGLKGDRQANPPCVCGSDLQWVSFRQRTAGHSYTNVICDICSKDLESRSSMWTCQEGHNTVMHPASYDVCTDCFSHHVGEDWRLYAPEHEETSSSESDDDDDGSSNEDGESTDVDMSSSFCPSGHRLRMQSHTDNVCDMCQNRGTQYRCRTCDFDLCAVCHQVYSCDESVPPTNAGDDETTELRSEWSCQRCTLINMPYARYCEACQASRPVED